jgi:hypothetical protein
MVVSVWFRLCVRFALTDFHPRRVESDLGTVAKGIIVRAVRGSEERVRKVLDEVE